MSAPGSKSEVVLALAEEFLERYRRGERPSLKDYADRHPELATEIREVFPAMALMENIALADEPLAIREAAPPKVALAPGESSRGADATPLAGHQQQLGDYRLIREVGHGGMGVVYEAEQVSLGRHVALKILPHKLLRDPSRKRRFEREAKAAAKLHHTNIVPVFGVGEHEGLPYYVMQFIQGQGLDQVLEELKRLHVGQVGNLPHRAELARSLVTGEFQPAGVARGEATTDGPPEPPAPRTSRPPSEEPSPSSSSVVLPGQGGETSGSRSKRSSYWQSVAQIGVQVADALEHAHKQGVLHRDIKPSNLLLDARGTVWVTDFGLAKADDQQDLTHTGDLLGTLRYMPPEAFDGKTDRRGDIYSLGLTLYELLALQPAFHEADRHKLLKQVSSAEPVRLDRLGRDVPRDLVTIVHKAIDREPARRYPSAAELAADLQRFLDDEPIRVRRMGPAERCWRWSRRNPLVATLLAALVGVFLLGFGLVTWQWLRADALRELAEENSRQAETRRIEEEKQRQRAEGAETEARTEADRAQREADRTRRLLYAADVQVAAHLWESDHGTARTVRDLLKAHEPRTGQEDLRDFAWYYQRHLLETNGLTLPGQFGTHLVAFNPNGDLLTYDDMLLRRWDLGSRRPTWGAFLGWPGPGPRSLSPDGKTVARGKPDGTVLLFEAATGQLRHTLKLSKPARDLGFARDGRRLVVLGQDNTATVYEAGTGNKVRTFAVEGSPSYNGLAASPDARVLLVLVNAPVSGAVTAYHAGGSTSLPGGETTVRAAACSPDGKLGAAGDASGRVIVWDLETFRERSELNSPSGSVGRLEFSPDNRWLAVGGFDGLVTVWDVTTAQRRFHFKGHTFAIVSLAFSADGKRLASGSADGTARIWDLTAAEPGRILAQDPAFWFSSVALSPDGRWLASASTKEVWVFDRRTDQVVHRLRTGSDLRVARAAFSPDSKLVAAGGPDVKLWDLATGRELRTLKGHPARNDDAIVAALAFSPDGKFLAAGHGWPGGITPGSRYDQVVKVWEVATGQEAVTLKGYRNTVPGLAFSPDSKLLATACHDGTLKVWKVGTWEPADGPRRAEAYSAVAFAPDGKTLAAGSGDGEIRLRDVTTGGELPTLRGHPVNAASLAFSPDGKTLASGSWDRTVRLWHVGTGRELRTLTGHRDWVMEVAFAADGKTLASASGDHTVRLWETAPRPRQNPE